MIRFSRRLVLKMMGASAAWLGLDLKAHSAEGDAALPDEPSIDKWRNLPDRVWLGEQYWANSMEDWCIKAGGAECISQGGDRSVHLLTHQIADATGRFEMSVTSKQLQTGSNAGGVGFRIGILSDINEYRSNCFAQGGIFCGIRGKRLIIGEKSAAIISRSDPSEVTLHLHGGPTNDGYQLALVVTDKSGIEVGRITSSVSPAEVPGNVALACNYGLKRGESTGDRWRFHDWQLSGDAFTFNRKHTFGPILWSMYTLSDSQSDEGFVMKLSALTGPLGVKDDKSLELFVRRNGSWNSHGTADLDSDCWTAVFRIPYWDEKAETPFKLLYRQKYLDGTTELHERTGVIRANPTGRPLRLGALTCQNDYAFPYQPVVDNLAKLDPDLLYFSGDQIYETHGGFGIIRNPADRAILNYLRKFYQFGWAFGEVMRSRPTLCIPDDHDVFQGNLWGEGGAKMGPGDKDGTGGYEEPPRMVNAVHKSCAGHHPDAYDATPCLQGISVYYGTLVYGDVGFAILGDRQFKSGPQHVETGSGRADHLIDAEIDPLSLDKEGLELLGKRQEKFLAEWVDDWRGHRMKVLLSQTVFAGVATHHGTFDGFLRADLDSGGWPQTPRNNAIRILRQGKVLHVNGDQHLTSLVQYGVDKQRDSCWSFCVPAIAVGYPRWWRPDELQTSFKNRPQHGLPETGEYLDGFGNKVYVYAVGNPEVASKSNRYERAHQKGSGFGLVTIDTEKKSYHCQSFRFLVDATEDDPDCQFPGWPLLIEQDENLGRNKIS